MTEHSQPSTPHTRKTAHLHLFHPAELVNLRIRAGGDALVLYVEVFLKALQALAGPVHGAKGAAKVTAHAVVAKAAAAAAKASTAKASAAVASAAAAVAAAAAAAVAVRPVALYFCQCGFVYPNMSAYHI
jgi:hypothetical protein